MHLRTQWDFTEIFRKLETPGDNVRRQKKVSHFQNLFFVAIPL